MFGHQDDSSAQGSNNDEVNDAVNEIVADTQSSTDNNQVNDTSGPSLIIPGQPHLGVTNSQSTNQPWQNDVIAPANEDQPNRNVLSPAGGYPKLPSEKVHIDPPVLNDNIENPVAESKQDQPMQLSSDDNTDDDLYKAVDGDLSSIKIQALDELYPLIDKLDLSPEDRFRTLMMMIQASDNQELVKSAYETAHSITDEKAKAQALLDIVNEINYFTQQSTT